MMSQLPGHVVSRALAKEKSTGLYDSHERKGNPTAPEALVEFSFPMKKVSAIL